jgi:DNA-binding GntR family transcriptional regulator
MTNPNGSEKMQTRAHLVLENLRDGILSGQYVPGTRLDQKQLAADLGVSLIPVREGLRQLEAEGLVRIEPRRGAFVAERSAKDVRSISLIRERLEELATQLAVPHLTDETLRRLDEFNQQMEHAMQNQDMVHFLELNRQFHFTIYDTSEQPLLVQIISGLWDRFRLYRNRTTFISQNARRSLEEHREIYQALVARDVLTAGWLIREHVRRAAATIAAKIEV